MPSSSHGAVTLPIWSETPTAAPHALNRHVNDGFLTIFIDPHQSLNNVPKVEGNFNKGHQNNLRDLRATGSGNLQVGQKQDEAVAMPRRDAVPEDTAQDQMQSQERFWNKDASIISAAANSASSAEPKIIAVTKSTKSEWKPDKGSIAAVVIISILTIACLAFLLYWYIARECKARRRRRLRMSENLFDQSSLTLGEETSRALDEFLMKDVEPERTSVMFSRSRSPSVAFVVDEADRRNSKASRTSYDASLNSLTKLDSLVRVSTEETRPSFVISELTDSSKSGSTQQTSTTAPHVSPHISPRASVASGVPSTKTPSQLWATTTGETTEASSLLSHYPTSPRSSLSIIHNANVLPSSASSQGLSRSPHASNASRSSSRFSGQSPIRSLPRMINDSGCSRRTHERTYSGQSQSTTISPIAESAEPPRFSAPSQKLSSSPTSPVPLFQFSDAS